MGTIFEYIDDEALQSGVMVQPVGYIGKTPPFSSKLRLINTNGRRKFEMAPCWAPKLGVPREFEMIFAWIGLVLEDPSKMEPSRPPGHFYLKNCDPTFRWKNAGLEKVLWDVSAITGAWQEYRDDGGSNYYEITLEGQRYTKQVVKRGEEGHHRTLIGKPSQIDLHLQTVEGLIDVVVVYELIRRLVVVRGDHGSEVGQTNCDLGGIFYPKSISNRF